MSLLVPKKTKYRKMMKGRTRGNESRGTELAFGEYGLKALEARWITSRQIEASRRTIIRFLRKGGKMWIRIFPAKPITRKGVDVPMGGGKGGVDHYAFPVRPGRVLFEIEGIPEDKAREAMRLATDKLPIKVKFIKR
jgi:large subunit ribosomal protein L16